MSFVGENKINYCKNLLYMFVLCVCFVVFGCIEHCCVYEAAQAVHERSYRFKINRPPPEGRGSGSDAALPTSKAHVLRETFAESNLEPPETQCRCHPDMMILKRHHTQTPSGRGIQTGLLRHSRRRVHRTGQSDIKRAGLLTRQPSSSTFDADTDARSCVAYSCRKPVDSPTFFHASILVT